jgi:arsenate reductase
MTGLARTGRRSALEEIGIQHQGRSKSVEEFRGENFGFVITVCDSAAEECPVWVGQGKRVHVGFADPTKASGREEEILEVFRQVRDEMIGKIPGVLNSCKTSLI